MPIGGVIWGWAFSYGRGTPLQVSSHTARTLLTDPRAIIQRKPPRVFEKLRAEVRPILSALHSSFFFFFFITLGLELSDTKVYEP
jgi:hypothetical protein